MHQRTKEKLDKRYKIITEIMDEYKLSFIEAIELYRLIRGV
jgi:hypothetical protein